MNRLSLMPDLQRLLNPPIDRTLLQQRATGFAALQTAGSDDDSQEKAKRQWELCKPLLEAKMFAVEPVPTVIHNLVNSYQADRNFPFALSLSCFLATECHPYAHVAPFKAWRVKGVMMIAGLFTHAAPLLATGELANTCRHKGLVAALSNCDPPSICEALSRLALHYGPMAHSEEWGMLNIARELLGDIESLPGREQESSLIRAWVANPEDRNGKLLFEGGILKPIKELASFAVEILTAAFENDGKAVVTRRR
jgi:SET and MYND domain-containing protein